MNLKKCWLCDRELTETREHIIPESMGGKRTVRGFICRDCNSTTGHKWDVAVIEFESWKFNLLAYLKTNPQQGKPIRGKMPDTGMNVFIESGAKVRLGFNPPVLTQMASGAMHYQFSCDPSGVDDLFASMNTLLERKGKAPMTRDEFRCTHKAQFDSSACRELFVAAGYSQILSLSGQDRYGNGVLIRNQSHGL